MPESVSSTDEEPCLKGMVGVEEIRQEATWKGM